MISAHSYCHLYITVLGGFSSYAKTNPFAQAMANSGKNSFASTPVSSFGAISASKSNFNMPPPLVLPSPKSPKANPFSSPSPANTQFVTIVENNDLLWKTMANDKLSADETAKSNTFVDNKTTSFRSAFFGGSNSHPSSAPSSFASVSAKASSAPTSIFGSTSSSSFATPAVTSSSAPAVQVFGASGQDEDGGDDDNDEQDEGEDGEPSSPSAGAGQASMKIISLPENVKLVTGEEEDECLLQIRAKLYRLNTGAELARPAAPTTTAVVVSASDSSDTAAAVTATSWLDGVLQEKKAKSGDKTKAAEWAEVGIGPLKILSSKAGSSSDNGTGTSGAISGRLVMRREDKQHGLGELFLSVFVLHVYCTLRWILSGGTYSAIDCYFLPLFPASSAHIIGTKLLLNVRLNRLLQVTRQNDKMLQLVCVNYADLQNTNASATIGTFLIKTKNSEVSTKHNFQCFLSRLL